jgi:glycosyltransferase involved in cell wall biosynthesis
MIVLAHIILIFTLIQFLVALGNLIFETSLPESSNQSEKLVSILIPARNEENNIGNILDDLRNQRYQNIEIIVFNDQSEDKTAEIVGEYIRLNNRIKLVNSDELPEGWLGKNYACDSSAKQATGEYLLFLDADVRIGKNIIGDAVSYSGKHDLALISIFPKQIIRSIGERITVPNMNYILASLLPLPFVKRFKYPSLAAANGQFMFFQTGIYNSVLPHQLMKGNKVEDILIAREFKKREYKIACFLGDDRISCRMYTGFNDSVNGFSKNVIEFFGGSFILAILFWIVTTFGILVAIFALPVKLLMAYLALYFLTRIIISAASHQNIFYNLIYFVPLQLSLGLFIYRAFINKYFRKSQWKGRNID